MTSAGAGASHGAGAGSKRSGPWAGGSGPPGSQTNGTFQN